MGQPVYEYCEFVQNADTREGFVAALNERGQAGWRCVMSRPYGDQHFAVTMMRRKDESNGEPAKAKATGLRPKDINDQVDRVLSRVLRPDRNDSAPGSGKARGAVRRLIEERCLEPTIPGGLINERRWKTDKDAQTDWIVDHLRVHGIWHLDWVGDEAHAWFVNSRPEGSPPLKPLAKDGSGKNRKPAPVEPITEDAT